MEAVILAAGKSERFWPLNLKHKGLFKIVGRPLIFSTIENLKKAGIREIIIVQGPKRDIQKNLKTCPVPKQSFWCGVKYVIQDKPLGTGDALTRTRDFIKERFFVLNGDDFYSQEDIKKCLPSSENSLLLGLKKKLCILLKAVQNPQDFGQVLVQKNKVKNWLRNQKRKFPSW